MNSNWQALIVPVVEAENKFVGNMLPPNYSRSVSNIETLCSKILRLMCKMHQIKAVCKCHADLNAEYIATKTTNCQTRLAILSVPIWIVTKLAILSAHQGNSHFLCTFQFELFQTLWMWMLHVNPLCCHFGFCTRVLAASAFCQWEKATPMFSGAHSNIVSNTLWARYVRQS
jgi:hypothetical protein